MIDQEKINLLIEEIKECRDPDKLKIILEDCHEFDIANILSELDEENKMRVMHLFNNDELADILSYNEDVNSSEILSNIDEHVAASILNEMEPDDAADIIDELEEDQAKKVLPLLDADLQEDIKEIQTYDDDMAGSIMNSHFLEVVSGSDVKDAMRVVVKEAPEVETIDTIFIVDKNEYLLGTLDLKKLIITKSPMIVDDIMTNNYQAVNVTDPLELVVKAISNYDTYVMPVLQDGKLSGIITMDDAMDALTDVVEEDYAKLAGITEGEENDESVGKSIKKRIPWLIILLFLDLVVSVIISRFSDVIVAVPVLAFFQAAVLGLAGNCGTQSLAVSVRWISTDNLKTAKDIFKHIGKELLLGLCTGIVLGIVAFFVVTVMLYINKSTEINPFEIASIISIAILVSVTVSNLFGSVIPIIFYKCKIDPAVASGPFITTINDIVVILIYFTVATIILAAYLA